MGISNYTAIRSERFGEGSIDQVFYMAGLLLFPLGGFESLIRPHLKIGAIEEKTLKFRVNNEGVFQCLLSPSLVTC